MRINEVEPDQRQELAEKLVDYIKENCQPYLKQNPEHATNRLYRGFNKVDEEYAILNINKRERPMNMPLYLNTIINNSIKEAGFDFTRDKCIFGTGDYETAEKYGKVNVLYPIDDFKFLWSKSLYDFFMKQREIKKMLGLNVDDLFTVLPDISNSELKDRHADASINDYSMLSQRELAHVVLGILERARRNENLSKIKFDYSDVVKFFKNDLSMKNLPQAIASKHEIMIDGSKVLLIREDYFDNYLAHMF